MANVIAEASVRIRPDTAGFQSETQNHVLGAVKKIAAAAAAAFAAKKIFDFGEQAVQEAAQTQKALENVQASYGKMTKSVTAFADSAAEKYGISRQASLSFSSSLAVSARNLGLSRVEAAKETIGYQKLAGSLGSIKGIDPASVFDKLSLAMLGNTRGLKQLGISFSSAQQKQEAMRLGIKGSTADWTSAQKAQVIYGLATSHLGSFMDQAKKHSGDLIDVQHRLTAEWANAKEEVGSALLPILERLGGFAARYLPAAFALLGAAIHKVVGFISDLAAPFAGVATQVQDFIGGVTSEYQNLTKSGIGSTDALQKTTRDTFQKLGVSFKDQKAIMGDFTKTWGSAFSDIQRAVGPVVAFVTTEFAKISKGISRNSAEIKQTILTLLGWWASFWHAQWAVISAVVTAVWPVIKTTIDAALKVIGDILLVAMDVITGKWGKAWTDLKQLVVDILQGLGRIVLSILTNIGPLILKALGLLAGVMKTLALALVSAFITEVANLPGQLWDLFVALGKKENDAIVWLAGKAKDIGLAILHALINEAAKLPGQIWDLLQLLGRKEGQAIGYVAGKAKDLGVAIVHAVVNEAKKLPGQIWDVINQIPGKFTQVWGKIRTGIASGWSAIVTTVEGWINKLLTPVNFILGKLGVDKIGFATGGIAKPTTGRGPGFASGGIVGPGKAGIYRPVPGGVLKMVEAGHPEAVIPLDPSKKNRALELINEVLNRLKVRPQAASGGIFSAPSFGIGGIAGSIAGAVGSAFDALTDPVALLKRFLPSIPDLGAAIPAKIAEGLMKKLISGVLSYVKGHAADGLVGRALGEATRMTNLHQPYLWGGGHAGFSRMGPWDCSGAVSQLLHAIGAPITSPLTSGGFLNWGKAGSGPITILTNPEHVYSMIAGRAYGTSDFNPGGGFGGPLPYGVRSGFTARTFLQGGIVPGRGPQPAVVHGGEMVLTNQDRQRFGGLTQLAQSVNRLVDKLDREKDGLRIGEVSFHTEQRSFDALRRDALNRVALGVKK